MVFLGGKIWYSSKPGKGSVFSFEVPVEFNTGSFAGYSESLSVSPGKRLKILIAEDDEISAIYLKELLAADCNVFRAGNGSEAVDMISRDPQFDCVLMDLQMPVLNGYEAARKIKDIVKGIPILAVTAFNIDNEVEKRAGISFDGYILKPVSKENLFKAILTSIR
jgi:CheY-like chemotaxis protein